MPDGQIETWVPDYQGTVHAATKDVMGAQVFVGWGLTHDRITDRNGHEGGARRDQGYHGYSGFQCVGT